MTEPPQELHQAAPTLAELRKLPAEVKDRLFLAKLARMSRNDANALHKGNITSFGDPYQMAKGYPPQEQREVIEHLFGGPWARLVHEGYLVQLNNQGFHKVSVEGHDYLNQPVSPPDVAPAARAPRSPLPDRIAGIRRGFISYSWDSEEHKLWVLALAERLRDDGIQIILDRWHLKLGQNKNYFMERAVGDSDFVVVICTPTYATKADQRQGGVGYEATIITSELADDLLTDKFIPVVREGTFKTAVPKYLKQNLGVNLGGDPYDEKAYAELSRQLKGDPIFAPPIGHKPGMSPVPAPASTIAATPSEATPIQQKPKAEVWARYDKPGQANAWISGIIRTWAPDRYSFEIVKGTENIITNEEFFGAKDRVISRFLEFHRSLVKDNYLRMQFRPSPDPDFRVIA
jgi:hypothetical protein